MKITIYDVFGFIFKRRLLITVIVLLSLVAGTYYVFSSQTYSAQVIIKYIDVNAKSKLTPNSEALDVYEIVSNNVITAAINELGIKASVNSIKANFSITPIIPQEEEEIIKSKQKEGEKYTYNPVIYTVKYTIGKPFDATYARDVLDAVIRNYLTYFSEKYMTQVTLPQVDYDVEDSGYDYLEVAEIMNQNVVDTLSFLDGKAIASPDFRSSTTGLSFSDLAEKYRMVKNIELPILFSDIFRGQITKDEDKLLKKYAYREQQLLLDNKSKLVDTDNAYQLMIRFVESNKKVPNSYNENNTTDEKNFQNNEVYYSDKINRTKTTYDKLVDNYVLDGIKAGELKIDANYCKEVVGMFSQPNLPGDVVKNITQNVNKNKIAVFKHIQQLYDVTDKTIDDFNNRNATNAIATLSGIVLAETLSSNFYMLISFVIGLTLAIILAIALEIINIIKKEKTE